jgi:glycosyltransferase involved in cell wall biosynthesis
LSLRIAYIPDERFPSPATDSQQMIKTADALGGRGCAVDFFAPRMARHLLRGGADRHRAIAAHYNVAGRFALRDLLVWPASDLRVEKLFHGVVAPIAAALGEHDVLYTRNVLPLAVAVRLGRPVLFETYRALPASNPRAWRAVLRAARAPCFLGIATHSEYSRERLVAGGVAEDSVAAVPNGYDPGDFAAVPGRDESRAALGLPPRAPLAVYTGHVRKDKGVGAILDLAQDVPEATFAVIGGSAGEVVSLRVELHRRGLGNVILSEHVPIARVPWYLAAADVLLVPPTAAPLLTTGRTVLPMKVFNYLAAGRPILAPDLDDTKGILIDGVNAVRVRPDDRGEAALALRRVLGDPRLSASMGRAAAADAKRFTWDLRAERLVALLERRLEAAGKSVENNSI